MTLSFSVSPARVAGAAVVTFLVIAFLAFSLRPGTGNTLAFDHGLEIALLIVVAGLLLRVLQRIDWLEKDLDQVIEQTRGGRTA